MNKLLEEVLIQEILIEIRLFLENVTEAEDLNMGYPVNTEQHTKNFF